MLRTRLAVLSMLVGTAVTIGAACSDDDLTAPPPPMPTGDTGTTGDGLCPTVTPSPGDSCALPNGTTCAFACGAQIARCLAGSWLFSGNGAAAPLCPKDFPVEDSPCPSCWEPDASCIYGSVDCTAADASANTTIASCPKGTWVLETQPCAILDAGADVQGDAEPDAD